QYVRRFGGVFVGLAAATLNRRAAYSRSCERAFKHPTDGAIVFDYPEYPSLHARHLYFFIGRKTENSVCPGQLVNSILPECWSIKLRAMDNPSPVPPSRPLTIG